MPTPTVSFKRITQTGMPIPTMATMHDAAAITGLTYSCLRRWILSGKFTYYVKAGNKFLVNMDRLAEFLDTPACAAEEGR